MDSPLNCLVRPLPLQNLKKDDQIQKYSRRLKRDDVFLRNLFQKRLQTTIELKKGDRRDMNLFGTGADLACKGKGVMFFEH